MGGPKIVVIGAGSFTFGFGILNDAIVDHRLEGAEMWMVDLDREMAEAMAAVGQRMAAEMNVNMKFAATADRVEALDGADFVTTSIANGLQRRGAADWRIARKHGIRQTMGECGSIGGLSYTLRSVPLVLSVCRDMERLCPSATLLNVTNPLTRVVLAANRYSSIRTVGFCNVALVGWRAVARALDMRVEDIEPTVAGLNHFSWFVDIQHSQTGQDLYPRVRSTAEQGYFEPLTRWYLKETGYLCATGDDHMGEHVPFDDALGVSRGEYGHGTLEERTARRAQVMRVAAGEDDWRQLHHSWERPMDYVSAVVKDRPMRFDMLNIPNNGAITDLPDDAIIEVQATVGPKGAVATEIGALPKGVAALSRPVAETAGLAVDAAVKRDIKLAHAAIDADPAIEDKAAARAALEEMIEAHADVLGEWRK